MWEGVDVGPGTGVHDADNLDYTDGFGGPAPHRGPGPKGSDLLETDRSSWTLKHSLLQDPADEVPRGLDANDLEAPTRA